MHGQAPGGALADYLSALIEGDTVGVNPLHEEAPAWNATFIGWSDVDGYAIIEGSRGERRRVYRGCLSRPFPVREVRP